MFVTPNFGSTVQLAFSKWQKPRQRNDIEPLLELDDS
jgi:hypothetical protein